MENPTVLRIGNGAYRLSAITALRQASDGTVAVVLNNSTFLVQGVSHDEFAYALDTYIEYQNKKGKRYVKSENGNVGTARRDCEDAKWSGAGITYRANHPVSPNGIAGNRSSSVV